MYADVVMPYSIVRTSLGLLGDALGIFFNNRIPNEALQRLVQ